MDHQHVLDHGHRSWYCCAYVKLLPMLYCIHGLETDFWTQQLIVP